MRRREVIKLAVSSTLTAMLLDTESKKITSTATAGDSQGLSTLLSSTGSIAAKISVDWGTVVARATPYTFGSNDYSNPK